MRVGTAAFAFLLLLMATYPTAAAADHDSYSTAARINEPGTRLFEDTGYVDDANFYTDGTPFSEGEILPDGQAEFEFCRYSTGDRYFGATAWYEVHPDVDGRVDVYVRGDDAPPANNFDAVLVAVRFDRATGRPDRNVAPCLDEQPTTGTESMAFNVKKGESWKVQIGGRWPDYPDGEPDYNYYDRRFVFNRNTDGDGKFDYEDECPTTPGDLANGCAQATPAQRPDADHDEVFDDGPDQCLNEDASGRDKDANGCLDLVKLGSRAPFDWDKRFRLVGNRYVGAGVKVNFLRVAELPKGTLVEFRCTRVSGRGTSKCGRRFRKKRVGGSGKKTLFRNLRLRPGGKVIIRTSADLAIGRHITFKAFKGDFEKLSARCLRPGSTKPVSCNSVSTDR